MSGRSVVWKFSNREHRLGERIESMRKRVKADIVQYGGSPVKIGEEEYHLFRDSE